MNQDQSTPQLDQKNASERNDQQNWQIKILPWILMVPTVLVAAFIFLATDQVSQINERLTISKDTIFMNKLVNYVDKLDSKSIEHVKYLALIKLEQESFYYRYNQAQLLLMSRIFTKYLGFFTGMILAIVGAVFIIGKLKEDTTEIEGTISDKTKVKIISSSPGIIFGLLGTILMITTIVHHNEISVRDMSLYLVPGNNKEIQDIKTTKAGEGLEYVDETEINMLTQDSTK